VLDIGTAKVCTVIAAETTTGGLTLLGLGHQRSRGLKSGTVIDPQEAEHAVRAAVGQAERMAGVSLDRAVVSVSCGRLRSTGFRARAPIEAGVVTATDVDRLLAGGAAYIGRPGRTVLQLTRSDWQLDDATGIPDPRGLAGSELAVDLVAVTAEDGPVRNLVGVVDRCHIATERLVAAPVASALAVSSEEERRLGVLVVDMGAGVTSLAAFAEGRLVHLETVPVGGNHVTFDIARELVTSVAEAERIKTLYGTLIAAASDAAEHISYPCLGEDESGQTHQTTKAALRGIVAPRVAGLLDLLTERIREAGLEPFAARHVVLTGGASQLPGLVAAWSRRFAGTARIGRPQPIGRMPSAMCSPAFAAVIGLLAMDAIATDDVRTGERDVARGDRYLDRIERWIRESF
jgi:cell division protein FtsA